MATTKDIGEILSTKVGLSRPDLLRCMRLGMRLVNCRLQSLDTDMGVNLSCGKALVAQQLLY